MLEKPLEKFDAAVGGCGAAHPSLGKRRLDAVDGVVVELAVLFDGPFPIKDVGLVPKLPVPRGHFVPAVPLDAVLDGGVAKVAPLLVVLWRIAPPRPLILLLRLGALRGE